MSLFLVGGPWRGCLITTMAKQSTNKMDKLKNFLGIGGSSSGAKASSANVGGARMSSRHFIFTAEMIQVSSICSQ